MESFSMIWTNSNSPSNSLLRSRGEGCKNLNVFAGAPIRFFRNLMLGEHHELKNRYKLVGYIDVDSTHTSTHTSTHASSGDSVSILSENIKRLLVTISTGEKSVKEMMEAVGLKNRPNFLEYSLTPAITEGLVKMKYPNSPRHPRQKYLLTVKGLMVYDNCVKSKRKI